MEYPTLLPRVMAGQLARAARVMPVVVLTGARQTGKSTLVRTANPDSVYVTLDSPEALGRARSEPAEFLAQAPVMVIDEVQRSPDLLLAIKTAVDGDVPRISGRFVLTGSANLLLLKRVRESLAGRAAYLTLYPLTRRELLGFGEAGIWSELLEAAPRDWRDPLLAQVAPAEDWKEAAARGGYPPAAYGLHDQGERLIWFDGYYRTYLQRDIPEISAIENIPDFDRVLRSVALRVGTVVNQTELARDTSIPQSTVNRYINVLEVSYLLHRLPAYSSSRTRQLVKSPRYYWCDSGLALALSREREPRGSHFENVVLQDLLAWRAAQPASPDIFYWRTTKGYEVDFVIDDGTQLLPIEVKTSTHVSTRDLVSLRVFLEEYADRAPAGLLLYSGDQVLWVAKNILAVPWWLVL